MRVARSISIASLWYLGSRAVSVHEDLLALPQFELSLEDAMSETALAELNSQLDTTKNGMTLLSPSKQKYYCALPQVVSDTSEKSNNEASLGEASSDSSTSYNSEDLISKALKALEPLKSSCTFSVHGWWAYEYCHLSHLRQFHQERKKIEPKHGSNDGAPALGELEVTSEYMLGRFDTNTLKNAELVDGDGQAKALKLRLDSGTLCDLTSRPRRVDIHFSCSPGPSRIASISESSACVYLVHIHTPELCSIGAFKKRNVEKAHKIECKPVVSDDDFKAIQERKEEERRAQELEKARQASTPKSAPKEDTSQKPQRRTQKQEIEFDQLFQHMLGKDWGNIKFAAADGEEVQFVFKGGPKSADDTNDKDQQQTDEEGSKETMKEEDEDLEQLEQVEGEQIVYVQHFEL